MLKKNAAMKLKYPDFCQIILGIGAPFALQWNRASVKYSPSRNWMSVGFSITTGNSFQSFRRFRCFKIGLKKMNIFICLPQFKSLICSDFKLLSYKFGGSTHLAVKSMRFSLTSQYKSQSQTSAFPSRFLELMF